MTEKYKDSRRIDFDKIFCDATAQNLIQVSGGQDLIEL